MRPPAPTCQCGESCVVSGRHNTHIVHPGSCTICIISNVVKCHPNTSKLSLSRGIVNLLRPVGRLTNLDPSPFLERELVEGSRQGHVFQSMFPSISSENIAQTRADAYRLYLAAHSLCYCVFCHFVLHCFDRCSARMHGEQGNFRCE